MNWHSTALALVGAAILVAAACAAILWIVAAAGAAVDQMRREEREQAADNDSEWLGSAEGALSGGVKGLGTHCGLEQ